MVRASRSLTVRLFKGILGYTMSFRKTRSELNSFAQWGFPIDLEAGPGSHELPGLIGKTSSRYVNTPTVSFSRGSKHLDKQYISRFHEREALGRESPGPCAHSLNTTFGDAAPRVAIGTGKARYLECFETLKNRSPGPIYSYGSDTRSPGPVLLTQGFTRGPQRLPTAKDLLQSPPPGCYETMKPKSVLTPSLKGRGRGSQYSRNLETFMKGKDSPGPKYMPSTQKLGRAILFPSQGHESAFRER